MHPNTFSLITFRIITLFYIHFKGSVNTCGVFLEMGSRHRARSYLLGVHLAVLDPCPCVL